MGFARELVELADEGVGVVEQGLLLLEIELIDLVILLKTTPARQRRRKGQQVHRHAD